MSKSHWLPASILVLAVALFVNNPARTTTQAQDVEKPVKVIWEYKIVRATEEILNENAAQGWEVVTAYGDVKGQSAGMRAINTIERAILKRPKAQ
ncbi:MAG: DUF4177 domain-containing protein [Planctomycetota bacterium]|nr:DUF4177 domain-containing protein [Planctomycetota bacterium]